MANTSWLALMKAPGTKGLGGVPGVTGLGDVPDVAVGLPHHADDTAGQASSGTPFPLASTPETCATGTTNVPCATGSANVPRAAGSANVPCATGSASVSQRNVDTAGDPILTARILIVDDEPYNVTAITKCLRDEGYTQVATLSDSSKALNVIAEEQPDLLLLDIVMPQVSGLEILRSLRADLDADHLPVLMLASAADGPIRRNALALGATDFLAKPMDVTDLVPRARNALLAGAQKRRLASQAEAMEREVRRRTAELATSRQEVIRCLALAAEYRDDDTGHHIMRVGRFAGIIARQLGFEEGRVEILELAAQLHDVGKIGIPDSILKTPGKLDPEQLAIMQRHSSIAKRILTPMVEQEWQLLKTHSQVGATLLGIRTSPLLMLAAKIAQTHHERWDGTGYPLGLAGKDIPIEGRITAVADVFDALSSRRCYKEPFPREKCFAILQEGRGTHFDPEVLDAFFARSEDVVRVQLEFMDIA